MSVIFKFNAINVASQVTNCSISVGKTQATGWSAHRKINSGQGVFIGHFENWENTNLVNDPDLSDSLLNQQILIPNFQLQQL